MRAVIILLLAVGVNTAALTARCQAVATADACVGQDCRTCETRIREKEALGLNIGAAMTAIGKDFPTVCGPCVVHPLCETVYDLQACPNLMNCGTCGSKIEHQLTSQANPDALALVAANVPAVCGECGTPWGVSSQCYAVWDVSVCDKNTCFTCGDRITAEFETGRTIEASMNIIGSRHTACAVCSSLAQGVPSSCAPYWDAIAGGQTCGALIQSKMTTDSVTGDVAATAITVQYPTECLGCMTPAGVTSSCLSKWGTIISTTCSVNCDTCGSVITAAVAAGSTVIAAMKSTAAQEAICGACAAPTGISDYCFGVYTDIACSDGVCKKCGDLVDEAIVDGLTPAEAMIRVSINSPKECGYCGVSTGCSAVWNTPSCGSGCTGNVLTCGQMVQELLALGTHDNVVEALTAVARQYSPCAACAFPDTPAPAPVPTKLDTFTDSFQLVWEDTFDTTTLDTQKWAYVTGKGEVDELQFYKETAVSISGGNLLITATDNGAGVPNSGYITTKGIRDISYGIVEIRMKPPAAAVGATPRIWLSPTDTTSKGVINLFRNTGKESQTVFCGVETAENSGANAIEFCALSVGSVFNPRCYTDLSPSKLQDEYHIYTLRWGPDAILFFIDNTLVGTYNRPTTPTVDSWPFTGTFNLNIALVVGGTFADKVVDMTVLPYAFSIDYVKVYQKSLMSEVAAPCSTVLNNFVCEVNTCKTCLEWIALELSSGPRVSLTKAQEAVAAKFPAVCGLCSVSGLCHTNSFSKIACKGTTCATETCGQLIMAKLASGAEDSAAATRMIGEQYPTSCGECGVPNGVTAGCYALWGVQSCDANNKCLSCGERILDIFASTTMSVESAMDIVGFEYTECAACSTVTAGVPKLCPSVWSLDTCEFSITSTCTPLPCSTVIGNFVSAGLTITESAMQAAATYPTACLQCSAVENITPECLAVWNTDSCSPFGICQTCGTRISGLVVAGTGPAAAMTTTGSTYSECSPCSPPTGVPEQCYSVFTNIACDVGVIAVDNVCKPCGKRILDLTLGPKAMTITDAMKEVSNKYPKECGMCGVTDTCYAVWDTLTSPQVLHQPTPISCGGAVSEKLSRSMSPDVAMSETAILYPLCSDCTPATVPPPVSAEILKTHQLVWEDTFTSATIDTGSWTITTGAGINSELQTYTESSVSVVDNKLVLTASKTGSTIESGSVTTKGKKDFTFGYLEVMAKVPLLSKGSLASVRLIPSADKFGAFPNSGEVTVAEILGSISGVVHSRIETKMANGNSAAKDCLLTATSDPDPSCHSEIKDSKTDLFTGFHKYAVLWTPEYIIAYFDEQEVARWDKPPSTTRDYWPFGEQFSLSLSLAVGGTIGGVSGVDETKFPYTLEIDSVRLYRKPPPQGVVEPCASEFDNSICSNRFCITCGELIKREMEEMKRPVLDAMWTVGKKFPKQCGQCTINSKCYASKDTEACVGGTCKTCGARITELLQADDGEATKKVGVQFPTECGSCTVQPQCQDIWFHKKCTEDDGCISCGDRINNLVTNTDATLTTAMNIVGYTYPDVCSGCSVVTKGVPTSCASFWDIAACDAGQSNCPTCGDRINAASVPTKTQKDISMSIATTYPVCRGCSTVPGVSSTCLAVWNSLACSGSICETCGDRILNIASAFGYSTAEAMMKIAAAFPASCSGCGPPTGVTEWCFEQWNSITCNPTTKVCNTCGDMITTSINAGSTATVAMTSVSNSDPKMCYLCGIGATCYATWRTPSCVTNCPTVIPTCGDLIIELLQDGVFAVATDAATSVARQYPACAACGDTTPVPSPTTGLSTTIKDTYHLVWEDNFNDPDIDTSAWTQTLGTVPNQVQTYTQESIIIRDGVLTISAEHTQSGITSGMIAAKSKSFKYGYIEISARLPLSSKGSKSVIGLQPTDEKYGAWPDSGSIDVVRHLGDEPGILYSALNTKAANGANERVSCTMTLTSLFNPKCYTTILNDVSTFRVYSMLWTSTLIEMYVDGVTVASFDRTSQNTNKWPFIQKFHPVIGLSFASADAGTTTMPYSLEIDYIKVYQIPPSVQPTPPPTRVPLPPGETAVPVPIGQSGVEVAVVMTSVQKTSIASAVQTILSSLLSTESLNAGHCVRICSVTRATANSPWEEQQCYRCDGTPFSRRVSEQTTSGYRGYILGTTSLNKADLDTAVSTAGVEVAKTVGGTYEEGITFVGTPVPPTPPPPPEPTLVPPPTPIPVQSHQKKFNASLILSGIALTSFVTAVTDFVAEVQFQLAGTSGVICTGLCQVVLTNGNWTDSGCYKCDGTPLTRTIITQQQNAYSGRVEGVTDKSAAFLQQVVQNAALKAASSTGSVLENSSSTLQVDVIPTAEPELLLETDSSEDVSIIIASLVICGSLILLAIIGVVVYLKCCGKQTETDEHDDDEEMDGGDETRSGDWKHD